MVSPERDTNIIDETRVRALARLARLELPDEEIHKLTGDLGKILAHVKQLEELDLTGVDPTAHVAFEEPHLRSDTPHPSLPVDLALREAPRVSMEGFAVPAFVDEG
ncbi:MAG: Asp-tRNA(Asn)/Glu-tRNA(Gln) amidotransferase subunit GatC [Polyangiaceae bacterium]|nr:Asp-tRNA(Asn)/Glu-tRNA(Gln) amidotransferase subunit GatC [Polyangiaceae bacterium]